MTAPTRPTTPIDPASLDRLVQLALDRRVESQLTALADALSTSVATLARLAEAYIAARDFRLTSKADR